MKIRTAVEQEVEQVLNDLIDRLGKEEQTSSGSALSLLENFVIEQSPSSSMVQPDLNNNHFDRDETNENLNERNSPKEPNTNPLESLEKMLFYPLTTVNCSSSNVHELRTSPINHSNVNTKKKKFDKYRLFAEKMLRSTFS